MTDIKDWITLVEKSKVYVKLGQKAPEGVATRRGKRGGTYYETGPKHTSHTPTEPSGPVEQQTSKRQPKNASEFNQGSRDSGISSKVASERRIIKQDPKSGDLNFDVQYSDFTSRGYTDAEAHTIVNYKLNTYASINKAAIDRSCD